MKIKLLIGAGVALVAAVILAPAVMEKMKPVNPTHNVAATTTTAQDTQPSAKGMTPEEAEALEEADAASADPDVAQPATPGDSVPPNTTEAEGGEE